MTSTYYAPHGGHPAQTELLTDRAMFTRVLRRAAARHHARHRHQQAAVLGRHPAVGDRPAAVRLRRDLLPVHRRGRPRRRQRQARARPRRRGRAVRRRGPAAAAPSATTSTSSRRAATPTSRPGSVWTLHNAGVRPGPLPLDPQGLRGRRGPRRARRRSSPATARSTPIPMPGTDGAWATSRFADPERHPARHARQHRHLPTRRVIPLRRDPRHGARALRAARARPSTG